MLQVVTLILVICLAAVITYWVKGEPIRYEPHPILESVGVEVPASQITLTEVLAHPKEHLIWVDARTRSLWMHDGVVGSLFISADPRENLDELIDREAESLFSSMDLEKKLVVVYCNKKGCSDSKTVVNRIKDIGFDLQVLQLFGGYSSLLAECAVRKKND